MVTTLTLEDKSSFFGNADHIFTLDVPTDRITIRQLIQMRVRQEVEAYNARQSQLFYGLVQPTDAERTLNGYKLRKPRHLDWQLQIQQALLAFERNGFIILINDRQVDELDAVIEVRPSTSVTFLKLVPLVGG